MTIKRLSIMTSIACLMMTAFSSICRGGDEMSGFFDVKAFGARADGATDDTAAIQKACDEAGKLGGVVNIPAGRYLVKGSIKVPPGVHIKGTAGAPQYSEPLVGTVILATGGRDNEDAPALFEMGSSCSGSGLVIYYPEQTVKDIRPYPWTFHLQGFDNTVENVTLVNSYNGIKIGPEPNVRHRIRSVYGCTLRRGIFVDGCTDIGRIDNVQLHGHWWWAKEVGGDADIVNKFMIDNLEAFVFGRTDWEYVTNTFVFPAKIGYRFIKTASGACNGQFCGIGSDLSQRCIVVEAIQPMGLLITNAQLVAFAGDNPVAVVIENTSNGSVRLVNCAFWGPSVQNVVSHGKGYLSLSNCYLSSGKQGNSKPLVEVHNGKLQIRGCTFATAEPSIALRKGLQHAIVAENNGVNGVLIINEIGKAAIISNNEKCSERP
ncbi:MAG: glycoside hydrolase family 55 protein [Armatimonadetes bacterium]|nr:glycoside hydrolase family 55 protein [Armatimonadota bacterium]